MKKTTCIWIISVLILVLSCSTERKSASYYYENKEDISDLRNYFDTLYRQQPFSAGFTDKTYRYYVMQIMTDTLRDIYNTEKSQEELWESIVKFHYDTIMLKKMAGKMKKVKCLWIGKADYFIGAQKEIFTYISFRSSEKIFRENKYYILVFTDHRIDQPEGQAQVKKGKLVPLDDRVYFTTGTRYR